jgi:hypothetical protein
MMPTFRPRTAARTIRSLALAAVAAIGGACDDPFASRASYANTNQTFAIAALTGADVTAPAGLSLATRTVVRIDGLMDFDLAFDIDPSGKPVWIPVGQVGSALTGSRLVGLLRANAPFESVSEAPKQGYVFDSTMVATLGATMIIQSQASSCSFSFTPYTFAKVSIDSIDAVTRTLFGRAVINLNCGFRQLTTGVPTF